VSKVGLEPMVSVLMPTYNRAHLIEEAIDSLLAQTYPTFELIVVDDGSEDDTRERIGTYADSRIHYLYQHHQGISASLNRGLHAARGRYIARLDSDDIWLPEMLEVQIATLEEEGVGVVYARAQGMDHKGRPNDDLRGLPPRYPGYTLESLLYGDMTCNITVVARRDCLEAAGVYDETLEVNEDWHMWLRVALHCDFAFNDRVLARFRRHHGNATGADSVMLETHVNKRTGVLDRFYRLPNLPPKAWAMRLLAYRNAHLWSGNIWLGLGQHARALRTYAKALGIRGQRLNTLGRILWAYANALLGRSPRGTRLLTALRRRITAHREE